jgi:hypothetical protein
MSTSAKRPGSRGNGADTRSIVDVQHDVLDVVDDRQVFGARTGSRRASRPDARDYGTLCDHLPIYSDAAQPEFMINIWFMGFTIISKQH